MQAKCKLAMKCHGILLPIRRPNHGALGKAMKRTSEQVLLGQVPVLTLRLKSWGTLGKSLHLSEPLACKMGRLGKWFLNLCSPKILVSELKGGGCSVQHHREDPDWDGASGFTRETRKDFSGLMQSNFLKNKSDFLYLLPLSHPVNMHYHCFNFCRLL